MVNVCVCQQYAIHIRCHNRKLLILIYIITLFHTAVYQKLLTCCFQNGNLQLIQVLLGKTDFVTKKNVDKYIQYVIDQKQQEIYLDLIRYKNAIMA